MAVRLRLRDADPSADLGPAIAVLARGGLVAYATDTLYGLAVDPRDERAVVRLFAVKGRPADSAVPLIAADRRQAESAGRFGSVEQRLADTFWPGPLSIIVPARPPIVPGVSSADGTVAIRVPAHPLARRLAAGLGYCITATSANVSGRPPTAEPDRVFDSLADRIDMLVDSGPAPGGPPSTIVVIRNGAPALVRAGAVPWERVLESLE
jgi:L-threonylcarbamoyladenylate synthase